MFVSLVIPDKTDLASAIRKESRKVGGWGIGASSFDDFCPPSEVEFAAEHDEMRRWQGGWLREREGLESKVPETGWLNSGADNGCVRCLQTQTPKFRQRESRWPGSFRAGVSSDRGVTWSERQRGRE